MLLKATVPIAHLASAPLGQVPLSVEGSKVTLGPFAFDYDAATKTLTGVVPEGFAPVYRLPLVLRKVDRIEAPAGPSQGEPWPSPCGATTRAPRSGRGRRYRPGSCSRAPRTASFTPWTRGPDTKRWSFRAGGPVRTRPAVDGGALFFQADDGFLYRLDAATGAETWRVRVVAKPVERLPFDNPKSRFDRFGSDVTVAGGRLYLGTHDGHVLALDAATGARVWDFAAGDSVLAAPAVDSGRVYAGSYDSTSTRSTPRPAVRCGSGTRREPWSRRPRWRATSWSSATAATTSSASEPRPVRWRGHATSGSPRSSPRPPSWTTSRTSARRTPRRLEPSTRAPGARAGRRTSTAGPGASPR